jgi:hypothetical protein
VKFWIAVGGAVLAMCGSAQASTVISPESGASYPYQRWVDRAKVPTPDVALTVYEGECPENGAVGCTRPDGTVWILPRKNRLSVRAIFLHELGHQFDWAELDPWGRQRFSTLWPYLPDDAPWEQLAEPFASEYARCTFGPPIVSGRRQVCALIRSAYADQS